MSDFFGINASDYEEWKKSAYKPINLSDIESYFIKERQKMIDDGFPHLAIAFERLFPTLFKDVVCEQEATSITQDL